MDNNDKRHPILKILLLDVSVFAGGALIAILFFTILFLVLNYFNLISLSSVYKPLSLLPRHADTKQSRSTNFSSLPSPSPTPTGFQYDVKKAQTLLMQYIKDTIKPEFLPAKITINQGQSIEGQETRTNYQFGSYYSLNSSSISANFLYIEGSNVVEGARIFISPFNIKETTASATLANKLTSMYFVNPYSIGNCQTKGKTSYCEEFRTEADGKKGFGIVFAFNESTLMPNVFTCFVSKNSKYFQNQNSCITP